MSTVTKFIVGGVLIAGVLLLGEGLQNTDISRGVGLIVWALIITIDRPISKEAK